MIVREDFPFVFRSGDDHPDKDSVVIAYRDEDHREQCQYRNGNYYVWRYGITDEIYVTDSTVHMWRGCTGFDF